MRNFFQPNSVHELAQAVTLCAGARCPFGVKSGGHGHFAGESCLDRGIQFDLFNINNIYIDKSKGSVLVGTGNNWGTVYTKLQKEGLIAVGGRSVDVEVGAFLIGGM
jgi:FAD/FMN-containing dehydrogenase